MQSCVHIQEYEYVLPPSPPSPPSPPLTNVRRELAECRVLFKSRLSRSVEGDMVSFQEEGEGTVAAMWFKVAHNARGTKEKMDAYKKAISTIKVGLNTHGCMQL